MKTKECKSLYVYNVAGKLLKTTTVSEFSNYSGIAASMIKNAAISFKGYGLIADKYYVSYKKIKLLNKQELLSLFGEWCNKNLKKIRNSIIKKVGRKYFCDDSFQEAILHIIRDFDKEVPKVNNLDTVISFKYRACAIDTNRVMSRRKDNGLMPDIDVVSESNNDGQCKMSYIGNFAEESYFDSHIKYNCVDDVNDIKRLDIIALTLKEELDYEKVDLFITILQTDLYDFTFETLTKPEFKTMTLVRRYKDYIVEMRKKYDKSFKGSNSAYLEYVFNECWITMIKNSKRIRDRASVEMYRDVDDYTLFDFINN